MIRVFGVALGGDVLPFGTLGWASPLVVIAALTITIGNITAVRQDNIKRMLAYSSISHAGVLLVGLASMGLGSSSAQSAIIYYLIAYSVTTLGVFAVVAYVGSKGNERLLIDDWAGLASQHPAAALAMTICLLSLGGMPPTGGFFGKFYIFKSAMDAYNGQLLWLVIIGVVNSAISIYYYLRIVTAMYFREATQPMRADAVRRARVRDGAVPAAGPRARHHARLVAPARRLAWALHSRTWRVPRGSIPSTRTGAESHGHRATRRCCRRSPRSGPTSASLSETRTMRQPRSRRSSTRGGPRSRRRSSSVGMARSSCRSRPSPIATATGRSRSRPKAAPRVQRARPVVRAAGRFARAGRRRRALHSPRDDPRRRARLSHGALASRGCGGRGARDLCAAASVAARRAPVRAAGACSRRSTAWRRNDRARRAISRRCASCSRRSQRRGGTYVATLPILAAFLDEPCAFSPYSPASRLYWNELYLDLDALAAQVGLPAPSAPPVEPAR